MNTHKQNSDEGQLSILLRESRAQPTMPPRFQENVWRRIEQAEVRPTSASWLEALAVLLLKPRFAIATAAIMLVTGTLLGSMNGQAQARQVAQERYVTTVAMPIAY